MAEYGKLKGGDKMQRALGAMLRKLQKAKTVQVGFLAGSTYPDGTPVALVAAVHNWGAPAVNVPERPFFSDMIRDQSPGWPKSIATLLKSTGYDADKTLTLTGVAVKGQLQDAIRNFVGAPLKPGTIKRKGFDKQLIDTAHMLNSVDFEVKR